MSVGQGFLLTDTDSLGLKVKNVSDRIFQELASESDSAGTLLDTNRTFLHDSVSGNSFGGSTKDFANFHSDDIISDRLKEIFEKSKDFISQSISTTTSETLNAINDTIPEVKVSRPEVLQETGLGTPEYVVIGACIIVLVLACLAIFLRIVMPVIRPKLKQKRDLIDDDSSDRKISGFSNGFTNFGTESDFHSSSSDSSSHSQDWSEVSSDQTRSTDADEKPTDMAGHYGQLRRHPELSDDFRGSSSSLPTYLSVDKERHSKSNKSSPMPPRRRNEDLVSVVSSHSLEPVHMEDNYRSRWDDQWDPYGILPRGNLSHLSHPSESRLSLSSKSTSSSQSNARFPTPSREQVLKVQLDKERRYPSRPQQDYMKTSNR